ncbi:MAG: leucine-rich repeat domain-containing protein [Lactobacillales bacterium]|jgi:hypothetical protein|nr:leucine-rich repeat domain-containing protein [Lactobacillales bacterium]
MEKSVIKVRFVSFCLILLAFVLLGNKQVNAASGVGDTVQDPNSGLWGVITKVADPQVFGDIGEVAIKGFTDPQGISLRCQQHGATITLNIPDQMFAFGNAYRVTRIASEAFRQCMFIGRVNIPNNVTNIGDATFLGCMNLTGINIPGSVTKIEDCAFRYCSSLTTVFLLEGLHEVGFAAFADCSSLAIMTFPDSINQIRRSALYGTRLNLEEIPQLSERFNPNLIFQNPVPQPAAPQFAVPFLRFS